MEVIDGIDVVIEGMKRETNDLEMWLANDKGIWRKNQRLFFPTFVFRI